MEEISIYKLYEISMTNKIIVSMSLPTMDDSKCVFKSYKVRAVCSYIHLFNFMHTVRLKGLSHLNISFELR